MYRQLFAAALLALPGTLQAGTVSTTFNYSRDNQGLFGPGAVGFNKSASLNLGIATVTFGASASTGDVDADASARVNATFADTVTLGAASSTAVSLALDALTYGFQTYLGANASSQVNFNRIDIGPVNVDPAPFTVISQGYSLGPASSSSGGLGSSTSDQDTQDLTGAGVPEIPGVTLRARVTLDASQVSTLRIDDLFGVVRATHTDGTEVLDAFSLLSDPLALLDLGKTGDWTLDFLGVTLGNTFSSSFGLAATAAVGFGIGFNCGDFATDSDNEFGCVADSGATSTSPQLTLLNTSPFGIDWGTRTARLGTIRVTDDPAPPAVPLPAGLVLSLTGLGALAGLGRRRRRAA